MRITGEGIWGEPADRDGALSVLRRAVELDVNLIDTADSYGPAVSEQLIAEALHPYPEDLVIATKGGIVRPSSERWDSDGRPTHLRAACEATILTIQSGVPVARIEFLDAAQIEACNAYSGLSLPAAPTLFVEFHGTEAGVAEQAEAFGALAADHGGGGFRWTTVAEERTRLWQARHNAYYAGKALRPGAQGLVTDCCVPISALADCIGQTRELIQESGLLAPLVGHVGDGNFHLLILIEPGNEQELERATTLAGAVNRLALQYGGTISGEHGIGSGKRKYMSEEHGAAYELMGVLKSAIDPLGIMNPGKIV
jgi:D-lactate dehydrogenase (cytochrome)